VTHSLKSKTILGLAFLFLFPGCAVTSRKDVVPPPIRSLYEGEYKVGKYLKDHQPKTVAILPFKNETKKEEAFGIVRKTFYNHFSSLRYGDLELFKVDQRINYLAAELRGSLFDYHEAKKNQNFCIR
jgi:hypothetical protein